MGQHIVSADEVIAAADLGEDFVDVPEWGGDGAQIKIRGLSVRAMNDANRNATVNGELDSEKVTTAVLVAGVSEPQFTPDQAGQLADKSFAVVNRVVKAIYALSGLDETPKEREGRFPEGSE